MRSLSMYFTFVIASCSFSSAAVVGSISAYVFCTWLISSCRRFWLRVILRSESPATPSSSERSLEGNRLAASFELGLRFGFVFPLDTPSGLFREPTAPPTPSPPAGVFPASPMGLPPGIGSLEMRSRVTHWSSRRFSPS
uniref:Putative secreted peptide n=1 Tax=Anopheles braziliensis TaxID=58242 RepID=A0A2M3ZQU2_9DIPT